jgi:RNA polymerase sigma-70 factor (ECF subfamily)
MTIETESPDFESGLKTLWLRAQSGDENAYREALRQIALRLRRYLSRRMTHMPDDMEDLVQETLLAVHLQRGTYDPAFPVTAWVTAIAKHKLIDLWRRRGRRESRHQSLDEVAEGELMAPHDGFEAKTDLASLLKELPAAQRQAIELTKLAGLSVSEVALQTGISESAIKVQVHRGLKRLALWVKGHP